MKLENLDPRVKLYVLLALSTASVLCRSCTMLSGILLLTVLVLLTGGVELLPALGRLRALLGLAASVFLLQCIFNRSGDALISVSGVKLISKSGFLTAGAVLLRLLILILSALIVLTGSGRDYLLALAQLRLPYELCFMVMAGLRFIPALRLETQDVLCAVQMRGTKIKGAPLRRRLETYVSIAVPVVAGALRRCEQMSVAMEARAFRSMPGRTYMRRLTLRRSDVIYLILFTAALILVILGGKLCQHL